MNAYNELTVFLGLLHTAANQYAADSFPEDFPEWFDASCGICDNWSNYTDHVAPDNREVWHEGREILKGKFLRTPGISNSVTPFNANITAYQEEAEIGAIWFNAKRRAWLAHEVNKNG